MTFYEILSVTETASFDEIKKAYRYRALVFHPDINKNAESNEIFRKIAEAYEVLSNPQKRYEYDKKLKIERFTDNLSMNMGQQNVEDNTMEQTTSQWTDIKEDTRGKHDADSTISRDKRGTLFTNKIFNILMYIVLLGGISLIVGWCDGNNNRIFNSQTSTIIEYEQNSDNKSNEISEDLSKIIDKSQILDNQDGKFYYVDRDAGKLYLLTPNEARSFLSKGVNLSDATEEELFKYNAEEKLGEPILNQHSAISDKNTNLFLFNGFLYNVPDNKTKGFLERKPDAKLISAVEIEKMRKRPNTGTYPYSLFIGKGKFEQSSLSEITIINGTNQDAIVLIYDFFDNVNIRNVYVRAGEECKLKNIPEGKMKMKTFYGNNWDPFLNNGNGNPYGGFLNNISFSQMATNDYFDMVKEKTTTGINYPTYSVTLHKVQDGNLKTINISKSDFFN